MTENIKRAYAASKAAKAAAQAADHALDLLKLGSEIWDFARLAYRLCDQAARACEFLQESLAGDGPESSELWEDARSDLTEAQLDAIAVADELLELAAAMGQDFTA